MSMWITQEVMVSEDTAHTATRVAGGWEVSWLPGRVLDRNQAVTGMVVAEVVADDGPDPGDRRWALLCDLAAELGLSGADAAAKASTPPAPERPAQARGGAGRIEGVVRS